MSEEENGRVLTAAEILAADDIEERWVDVPEWRGRVKVRALTLKQMAVAASRASRRNPQTGLETPDRELAMLYTLQEGLVEPKLSPQDVKRLGEKSAAAITRIVQAINAMGPTQEAVDEADKSLQSKPDSTVSVRAGAGTGDDLAEAHNGHVHEGAHPLDGILPAGAAGSGAIAAAGEG